MSSAPPHTIHTLPAGPPRPAVRRPLRSLLLWTVGAGLAGGVVGLAVELMVTVLTPGHRFELWFVKQAILFAEAVGVSAVVASRYAFPLLDGLRPALRYGLVLMTLVGGALAATALSLLLRPGLVFTTRLTALVGLVGANIMLSLVIGGALITWENLKRSLQRAYEELRVKEAFEREMHLAREVQQGLLPSRPPEAAGWDIACHCRTAALVGGDTMDFVTLPGGRLALVVGDVSGKGVAAALLMANMQALARTLVGLEDDPGRINALLSTALLSRVAGGRYVTFALLALDLATGRLRYSLAGHLPPIIVGAAGLRLLERGGAPLGLLPEAEWETGEDQLAPGETLIAYTDGLVEAPGAGDPEQELGLERLSRLALACYGASAEGALGRLLAALEEHLAGAPPADDTTLVVVRRCDGAEDLR